MHSETRLSTYDPDWEAHWERCHAALTASRVEQRSAGNILDAELEARCSRELNALHAAYHAQFRTTEAYFDHFMTFHVEHARGLDVALPQLPGGASLEEAKGLLKRFWAETDLAQRDKYRPFPADPPNLAAFATPPRAGCQRTIEQLSLPRSPEGPAVDCILIMEATSQEIHVCLVHALYGGSATNNIERIATHIYNDRFAPRGTWQRAQAFLGRPGSGMYRPESLSFYDYLPFAGAFSKEDFSLVNMTWSGKSGFTAPRWRRFPSTPVFVAEAVRRPATPLRTFGQRVLASDALQYGAAQRSSA
jgi:hypothetical protein